MISDGFDVRIDTAQLDAELNKLSKSLRRDKINKVIRLVMEEAYGDIKMSLRKNVKSQEAYDDIIDGYRRHNRRNTRSDYPGIYIDEAYSGNGTVISISQSHADYRLHFFENGTVERIRKDNRSTGSIRDTHFMSDVLESKADYYSDKMMKLIKDELSL